MGTAVVVIVYPDRNPLLGVLEAVELGPHQELLQDRLPEPLDFTQRHRVMRAASDMFYPVFLQFPLEGGRAPPVDVLAAVVGQHLFGDAVFSRCPSVRFQHVRRRLAPVKPQAGYIARVVVDKADQVRVRAGQAECADIRLPQLVRLRSFEEPRFWGIACRLYPFLLDQLFFNERLVNRCRAGLDKEEP